MKRALFLLIYSQAIIFSVMGQGNLQVLFGYRGSIPATTYLPSTANFQDRKIEISIQYNLWLTTRNLTYEDVGNVIRSRRLSNQDIDKFLESLDDENTVAIGQDALVLGLGYKMNIKNTPVVWSFTISDRFNADISFPKELPQFIWKGNRQFEGETIDLSNTRLDAIYFREFAFGAAFPVLKKKNWQLFAGANINYYLPLAALIMKDTDFSFTTALDAEFLELTYQFDFFMSGVRDFNLFDYRGSGWGGNFGTTLSYKKNWFFDIGFTDFGSINFDRDIEKVEKIATIRYTGLDRDALNDPETFLDSLFSLFESRELSQAEFDVPVGVKMSLAASYRLLRDKENYDPYLFSIFYRQSLNTAPGESKNPRLTLGVNKQYFRFLRLGLNTSWGGFNGLNTFALGGMVGFEFGHFRLAILSDDFTGFVLPSEGKGIGLGVLLQGNIGRRKPKEVPEGE